MNQLAANDMHKQILAELKQTNQLLMVIASKVQSGRSGMTYYLPIEAISGFTTPARIPVDGQALPDGPKELDEKPYADDR